MWIETLKLLACLLRQMSRNDHKSLVRDAEPLCLHDGRHHLEGLARTDTVREKRAAAVKAVRHGVLLVRVEGNRVRHPWKMQMGTAVLTRTDIVEIAVVVVGDELYAPRVLDEPLLKRILDLLLLHLRCDGLFAIHDLLFIIVCWDIDDRRPKVECPAQKLIGILFLRPPAHCCRVAARVCGMLHLPFARLGGIRDRSRPLRLEFLLDELLDIACGQP